MTDLDIDIKLPRITIRQTQRSNTPATCPEEYYRRVLFIPILENVIEDLKARFLNEKNKTIFILMQLVPINVIKISQDLENTLVETLLKHYSFISFNTYSLKGEMELWKTKWEQIICKGLQIPNNVFNAIEECPDIVFPCIRKILFILCTLPVSVATAERSFSTLRRLKSWLRSRMNEERLTGLALSNIHRNEPINIDNIIDRFAASNKRALEFVI
ncbi:unnamed protein product [Macrosiphum euphorbiae]|uniref:HAT C-terminal dimerisation domain-containing protein n=1 Tax=Macrosiphum euphorbiae TaxID=13131 RepID=A0AAV0W1M5_9HEMI|nr:unnamed protein product [Macrosiphum euphorbiae]